MTIEVQFVDAAKEGACLGCSIRHYTVAKIRLGRLEVRLCGTCADAVLHRLNEQPHFLRTTKVVPRGMRE